MISGHFMFVITQPRMLFTLSIVRFVHCGTVQWNGNMANKGQRWYAYRYLVGKLLCKCPLVRPSGQFPREWTVPKRKTKLARDDARGGLPVLSALNLLTLCYCIVLYYLLIVLKFIGVCKRCGVLFGIEYFLKLWYFSLVYTFGIQLTLCAQPGCQFTIGQKMADGLLKEEPPPRICHLRPSLVPSSFSPHVSGFSQEVEWTEDP